MTDTTAELTNAEFAGYAARLAQKASAWAADTTQAFRICAPDEAMDREPATRFIAEMRRLLKHMEAQIKPAEPARFYPQDGAVYRHHKGGLYRVLMNVLRESDGEHMVVYQPQDETIPWVRPLSEFGEKFSYVSNVGWEPA